MKLAIINGSPRGKTSNSDRIIGWMTEGIDDTVKVYAREIKKQNESIEMIKDADSLLIVFPLYTDAMPGVLKAFFEKMDHDVFKGKYVTFVIHSGFPEATQSRLAERYCRYFAKINEMKLLGCCVMGGSEAFQVAPDNFFGKRVQAFRTIGENIASHNLLDEKAIKIIAGSERYSKIMILLMKLMPTDFYWNGQLKKNQAFDKRFDRPYE